MSEIETPEESGALLVAHGVWVDSLIGGDDMEPADLLYVTYQDAWLAGRSYERARLAAAFAIADHNCFAGLETALADLELERQRSAGLEAEVRVLRSAFEHMERDHNCKAYPRVPVSLRLAAARDAASEDSAR